MRIFFIIFLLIGGNSLASQNNSAQNLKFEKGLDHYQTIAVIDALSEDIQDVFNIYLKESHFPYGTKCRDSDVECKRQNLKFGIEFEAVSIDLNADGVDDVLVRLENSLICGSGGCLTHILVNQNGSWLNFGYIFGASNIRISNSFKNNFQIISYQTGCRIIEGKEHYCIDRKAEVGESGTY